MPSPAGHPHLCHRRARPGRRNPKTRVGGTWRWRRARRPPSGLYLAPHQRLKHAESRNRMPGRTRWPNRDPIESNDGAGLYGHNFNNTLFWIDPDGREPVVCDPLKMRNRARSAARSAGRLDIGNTVREGTEYCGLVCQTPDCKVYTTRRAGQGHECNASEAPCDSGDKRIGLWHTHPTRAGFSLSLKGDGGDIAAYRNGEYHYVTNPDGTTYEMYRRRDASELEDIEFYDVSDRQNVRRIEFQNAHHTELY